MKFFVNLLIVVAVFCIGKHIPADVAARAFDIFIVCFGVGGFIVLMYLNRKMGA